MSDFSVKYKGIKLTDPDEKKNWDSKLLHFTLKHPYFFYTLFKQMKEFCEINKIAVNLTEQENNIIKEYEVRVYNGSRTQEE